MARIEGGINVRLAGKCMVGIYRSEYNDRANYSVELDEKTIQSIIGDKIEVPLQSGRGRREFMAQVRIEIVELELGLGDVID